MRIVIFMAVIIVIGRFRFYYLSAIISVVTLYVYKRTVVALHTCERSFISF